VPFFPKLSSHTSIIRVLRVPRSPPGLGPPGVLSFNLIRINRIPYRDIDGALASLNMRLYYLLRFVSVICLLYFNAMLSRHRFSHTTRNGVTMEQGKLANPAPLGLMGFGMTTVLLNIHNAGYFPIGSMILSMGIFYGGIAQIIAGVLEYKKGNTFGLTAFVSYGFFWLSLVFILLMKVFVKDVLVDSEVYMGWYLFIWGVFTFFMWFGTFGKNKAIQFVFLSLTILFVLLALRDWIGSGVVGTVAGYEGILCGASAIYLAMAEVLSEAFGREVLPIGSPKKK